MVCGEFRGCGRSPGRTQRCVRSGRSLWKFNDAEVFFHTEPGRAALDDPSSPLAVASWSLALAGRSLTLTPPISGRRSVVPFGVSSGGLGMTFGKSFPGIGGGEEGLILPSVPSGGRNPKTTESEVPGWPGVGEHRASI